MPYIKQDRRDTFASIKTRGLQPLMISTGELNYEITMKIKNYLDANGISYATINDIIGALEGAKMEFYRRIVVPYEDTKIKENGDVY